MGTTPSKERYNSDTAFASASAASSKKKSPRNKKAGKKESPRSTGMPKGGNNMKGVEDKNEVGTASTQGSQFSALSGVEQNPFASKAPIYHGNGIGPPMAKAPPQSSSSPNEKITTRSNAGSSVIHDETVKVNLAMADLMAYLQVVANNSSNLPLTRRDDPELGKTVSTLTSEEYARKSAAFLPSDVKILSGSFLKYGSVWDLPTSEEFDVSDSTQEPGISHGGACCNALLKVLYDTEAESSQAQKVDYTNATALFEEEEDHGSQAFTEGPSLTFDSLVLGDTVTGAASITWADLLRKMKAEMRTSGFAQVPAITSSRKFDLKSPFTLIPPNFDPTKNKKRSLLIGCNYADMPEVAMKACHDDIRSIKDFIVNVHGFPESKGLMSILLDDGQHKPPTHLNITEAFKALSEQSQPGDAVFVQFSGHGCRTLDTPIDADIESYDEAIIPCDYRISGMIRDTLVFKTLLAPMRYGVTVTCLFDVCDTGIMIDLPYCWSTKNDRETDPKMTLNDNFSFVRFLKVIKTLYESSTFTQLGKTVRSVLHEKMPNTRGFEDEDQSVLDESTAGGSLITVETAEGMPSGQRKPSSSRGAGGGALTFMNYLNACHSPSPTSPDRRLKSKYTETSDAAGTKSSSNSANGPATVPSLFQQVLSCGFSNPVDFDEDDDTFLRADTEEGDTDPSFHTDDDYDTSFSRGGRDGSARSARSAGRS